MMKLSRRRRGWAGFSWEARCGWPEWNGGFGLIEGSAYAASCAEDSTRSTLQRRGLVRAVSLMVLFTAAGLQPDRTGNLFDSRQTYAFPGT
jgi:hypothetical protein